jgi:peptidyl-prolyl cis-trans isomerase D
MQVVTFVQKSQAEAPDAKLGAAVFATAVGRVTGPVEGITWSAARVTEIVPGSAQTYEQARDALRAELAREEAETLMHTAVEAFEEARGGGADIDAAATQAGLRVSKTPLVTARGLSQDGQPEPTVLDQADLLKAVFEAAEGDPTDWVSEPDGGSYLVRIDQLKPPGPPPLAQVRARVAEAWRLQKIGQAMAKVVEEIAAAVRGGASFADAARTRRLLISSNAVVLDRQNAQRTASQQLAGAIFAARAGDVVSGFGGPLNDVMFVAHVEKVERDDPASDPQRVQQRRLAMTDALTSDALATIQSAARADARVRLNQPLIDRIVGKDEAEPAS